MKHYYIHFEVGEGYPDYEFVIKAKDFESAKFLAGVTLSADYPEQFKSDNDFYCIEITAEQLLERLTIN
jgi:hypothetical protein